MSDLYSNWIPHLIALIAILLLCVPTLYLKKIANYFQAHKELKPEQVREIRCVKGTDSSESLLSQKHHLISWYNQSIYIQKRPSWKMNPEDMYMEIALDHGDTILIFPLENDLQIERKKANDTNGGVSYWAKHPELRSFILTHFNELKSQLPT